MFSEAITKEKIGIPPRVPGDIRTAGKDEESSAVAIITSAFSTDPAARWMYPDPADYLAWFPTFVRLFAGRSFESGTAYIRSDRSGTALWLPPGVEPDSDPLIALFWESTTEDIQKDLFPVFEEMGNYHPHEPHWYLPMIGVDTFRQGKGAGSGLMKYAVTQIDAEKMPAYLESSNPRNVPLYEGYGFEVMGTIRHGDSPPIYPMIRRAR